MKSIKVKDSKLLTKEKREELFPKIQEIAHSYEIIIIDPEEIDHAVKQTNGSMNLNRLEAKKTAEILNVTNPDMAQIDLPSNNKEMYQDFLKNFLHNKKIKLILEHKADVNYPSVAAASILAKVTRDSEIEKLHKEVGINFGSGYMSDPKTIEFFEKHYETYSHIFRKSWLPYQNMINKKFQSTLENFSQSLKKDNDNKPILEKLKILEEYGFQEVKSNSAHEQLRLKGFCTVVLYKNGKLLIQGTDVHKKQVERLLGV